MARPILTFSPNSTAALHHITRSRTAQPFRSTGAVERLAKQIEGKDHRKMRRDLSRHYDRIKLRFTNAPYFFKVANESMRLRVGCEAGNIAF
jgi:hypothetical protein